MPGNQFAGGYGYRCCGVISLLSSRELASSGFERSKTDVDTVVADWVRIGVAAAAFILVLKLIFLRVHVPGLSDAVAAI